MKKLEVIIIAVIVVVIALIVVINPSGSTSFFSTAGGGLSLKDMNQKDTTATNVNLILQANQTTNQNLEQGLVVGNYYKGMNGFFVNSGVIAGVSTEYGICCQTMYIGTGLDFNTFQIEYKVGNFKRTGVMTGEIDPQYSNFCIDLGEGASASKAMQVSFIKGNTKIGFGHQGVSSFYDFSAGGWYTYLETPICKGLTLAGGVDINQGATGYVAAKVNTKNNQVTVTGNKIGTENQNVIVTYSRKNIAVRGKQLIMTVSAWAKQKEQGAHMVAGLIQGRGMFFAEVGSKYCENQLRPYAGVGTSFTF